jgi:hypothetical protein
MKRTSSSHLWIARAFSALLGRRDTVIGDRVVRIRIRVIDSMAVKSLTVFTGREH